MWHWHLRERVLPHTGWKTIFSPTFGTNIFLSPQLRKSKDPTWFYSFPFRPLDPKGNKAYEKIYRVTIILSCISQSSNTHTAHVPGLRLS